MESTQSDIEKSADGFTKHRCTCHNRTVLGSFGTDSQGRFVYKVMIRDRIILIYFGATALLCRDCKRWTRLRVLPREKKAEITPMHSRPDE